jgi:hypothetical protein
VVTIKLGAESFAMAYDNQHYTAAYEEIQRHLEDTEVSKLAHFYAAAQFEKRHKFFIGIPATAFAIILTWLLSSPLEKIFSPSILPLIRDVLPIILSLIVAMLSALGALLNFNDLAIKHRTAAEKYHALWRHCVNWKTDFPDESMVKEAVEMTKQHRERLNEINRDSPQIPRWAWKSVPKQKKEGSTSYKIIDEVKGKS